MNFGKILKNGFFRRAAAKAVLLFLFLFSAPAAHAACSNPAGVAGDMMYNSSESVMQYCNDTNWVAMGHKDCALPDSFDFTDLGSVTANTTVTSEILQITGLACDVTVSISTDYSHQFRICDDSSCTSVDHDWGTANQTIQNNQYLQLSITSSSAGCDIVSGSVYVGSGSDSWLVQTESPCD